VNVERVAFYGRVNAAEERLEDERKRRGVPVETYDAAQILDEHTGEEETEDLARLARSVAALGGRLEVNAVFPDKTIQLLIEPEPNSNPA
jgi:hypothetical protein